MNLRQIIRSRSGTGGLDGDFGDEGLGSGDVGVTRIGGTQGGEPCGMEERAEGGEPPAGDDDIVGGKAERQPFGRSILAALKLGVGIEEVADELRVREAVDAPVAGEEVEHQYGMVGFLDAAGFFVGGLS